MRLFAVSRQVFAEAVKVFYEVNVFSIDTNPGRIYKDIPLFIRQSTESKAPRPMNSIKKVSFNNLTRSIETDEFFFLWKIFYQFLAECPNLRTIEMAVRWDRAWDDTTKEALKLRFEVLRDMLRNLRSPKGAIFADVTTSEKSGDFSGSIWHVRRITIAFHRRREKEATMATSETKSVTE